jgi:hypothetical protein
MPWLNLERYQRASGRKANIGSWANAMPKSTHRTNPLRPVANTDGAHLTLGGQCCDKDSAKFYFNALTNSGEVSSWATKSGHFEVPSSAPCLHLSARLYWQHLLCATSPVLGCQATTHAPSLQDFIIPTATKCRALSGP